MKSTFDPSVALAVQEFLKDSIQDEYDEFDEDTVENLEDIPEPKAKISSVNEKGEVRIEFNQEMAIIWLFEEYGVAKGKKEESVLEKINTPSNYRRL